MFSQCVTKLGVGFFCILLATQVFAKNYKKVTVLTNDDFKYGTYIIDKPGRYKLGEDISFNPNSPATLTEAIDKGIIPPEIAARLGLSSPVDAFRSSFPLFTQLVPGGVESFSPSAGPLVPQYDPSGFGLGFFAAIVIQADNVVLDLAGHTLEQSEEHALLQRFFALIELAEQPFIPNQGPADFGSSIISAKNVVIKNGTLGRSSHHGIHGNGNKHIKIINVDFVDYEVGAVALNGVNGLVIRNSNAENRKDVPVVGTYSSAQFIKTYVAELLRKGSTTELNVNGETLNVTRIINDLAAAVNNVHEDLIIDRNIVDGRPTIDAQQHPEEFALFHNKHGIVDGNSYSFLVNQLGIAVNGFPTQPDPEKASKNIWMSNVHVENQRAFINEIVALNQGGVVIDPVGAVFQTLNTHPVTGAPITVSSLDKNSAKYTGNAVANAQAFVAKAFLNGEFDDSNLDLKRLSINENVLKWVEANPGFENLVSIVPTESDFLCNGDSMFHVNKGVIAFKMDAAKNVILRNTSVNVVENIGKEGSTLCGDYSDSKSHPAATLLGYGGAKTRAFTFSGSKNVILSNSSAMDVKAASGTAIGVDVLNDTNFAIVKNTSIVGVDAGVDGGVFDGPNEEPEAIGFHVGENAKRIVIKNVCADLLDGFADELIIDDESDSAFLIRICK